MKTQIQKQNAMPRTIVITGATSGIGHSTALAFAKFGANVAIFGRPAARLAYLSSGALTVGTVLQFR